MIKGNQTGLKRCHTFYRGKGLYEHSALEHLRDVAEGQYWKPPQPLNPSIPLSPTLFLLTPHRTTLLLFTVSSHLPSPSLWLVQSCFFGQGVVQSSGSSDSPLFTGQLSLVGPVAGHMETNGLHSLPFSSTSQSTLILSLMLLNVKEKKNMPHKQLPNQLCFFSVCSIT